ncbi:protein YgfX [Alkalimonas sp. NCh-2]|uniref:protein YgfX n=1 Tax=Alkalimonas sp. NCh-2 TaxID=3144846 RepID=UPI0031F715EA
MYASSLSLTPSRWRRGARLGLLGFALLLSIQLPLAGHWLLLFLCTLFAFAWCWWQSWHRPEPSVTLLLGEAGEVRWLPACRPAGVLTAHSLLSPWAILLCWQSAPDKASPQGRTHRCWVLADQCSDADFRAIARVIRQCRWLQASVN